MDRLILWTPFIRNSGRIGMRRLLFGLTLGSALTPGLAEAKDLRGRLGLGYNNQFSEFPALSARYYLPAADPLYQLSLDVQAGFQSGDPSSQTFFGGRLGYAMVVEDNMNLFVAAGVAVESQSDNLNLRIHPSMGSEFFLFGLDNLGFTAEWDRDPAQMPTKRTVSAHQGSVHYYFVPEADMILSLLMLTGCLEDPCAGQASRPSSSARGLGQRPTGSTASWRPSPRPKRGRWSASLGPGQRRPRVERA